MSNFNMLCEPIKNGIIRKLGWKELMPVQEEAIPEIISGKNAIIFAPTAGGKTEAAFLPILHIVYKENIKNISIIYVSPVKALLNNQEARLKNLASFVYADVFKWHGDVQTNQKFKSLKNLPNILMITPESLEVIFLNKKIDKKEFFHNIRFIVVDEIHSFADSGRGIQLMSLIERIKQFSIYDIQRIGLSATVGNPETILKWMQGSSKRKSTIINDSDVTKDRLIEIKLIKKSESLGNEIYKRIYGKKALFFCNSRNTAEGLKRVIEGTGIEVYVHHSSIDKRFREIVEEKFKFGNRNCIIATSTLELGIDIGDLDIVLQLDAPNTVSSFLQRIGRAGRRKNKIPHFVFFPTKPEKFILAIAILNLAIKRKVEKIHVSKLHYDIMFHQILTISMSEDGVDKDSVFEILRGVYSFCNIKKRDYEYLLNYMADKKFIQIDRNKIYIDIETEKVFGGQNFITLFSVFETNKEFTVKYKNISIGTLERWFVNALGEKFQFTLAGRCWQIDKIDYDKSIIYVVEAKSAIPPKWISNEGFYSFELSQEILKILVTNEDYSFLNNYEKDILKEMRYEGQTYGIETGKILIEDLKDGYLFTTYAGNNVNYTFAKTLSLMNSEIYIKSLTWKGFKLLVYNKDFKPTNKEILSAINKIKSSENYFSEIYDKLIEHVPDIPMSKYQKYLPESLRKIVLADYIYDIDKTKYFIKNTTIKLLNI